MPKKESLQEKIARVRPPRIQITYDVEVGGAACSDPPQAIAKVTGKRAKRRSRAKSMSSPAALGRARRSALCKVGARNRIRALRVGLVCGSGSGLRGRHKGFHAEK